MAAAALARVLPALRCPVCASGLTFDGAVRCASGHSFDLARQGYLSLLGGRGVGTGDTSEMVAARTAVLDAGVFDSVTAEVVRTSATDGLVLDLAGGTGHHLAAVLDASPDADGVCVDASAPALRRAASAHPRAAAVGADAWAGLPFADASISSALSIFGPRNGAELRRILRPDGRVIVVAPASDHLRELVEPLGVVGVDPRKAERQAGTFAAFTVAGATDVRYSLEVGHGLAAALIGMGPSGAHLNAASIAERVNDLPETVGVTVSVVVTTYLP